MRPPKLHYSVRRHPATGGRHLRRFFEKLWVGCLPPPILQRNANSREMHIPEQRPLQTEVVVSWSTLFKLLIFGVLVLCLIKLHPLACMLLLAIFIAITLAPVGRALHRHGAPRWLGIAVCSVLLLGSVSGFFFLIVPLAAAQIGTLLKSLPTFKEQVLRSLPDGGPAHEMAAGLMQSPAFTDSGPLIQHCVNWGTTALGGLMQFLVVLVFALYLLADGRRVFEWLLAFVSARQRSRVAEAAPQIENVILSYMRGQLITSLLCAVFTFAILTWLKVPNALLLALLAGVFDVLPMIGFFFALIPAAAMALTVSPTIAGVVIALYTFYNLIENYIIVPRVYGNNLRLSGLTVFVACIAAGMVQGVIGIIVVLPLVASYPIIERIWLRPLVGAETVARHEVGSQGTE
jgi:predicted PurR-regulated permease PerM